MARKPESEASQDAKLEVALICDGVRKEVTGQESIIGAYPESFNTDAFPINFLPTLYLRIRFGQPGTYMIQFRVVQGGGIRLMQPVTFPTLAQEGGASSTVVVGPMPLAIQSAGLVSFGVKIADAEWRDVCAIEFKKAEFKPVTAMTG